MDDEPVRYEVAKLTLPMSAGGVNSETLFVNRSAPMMATRQRDADTQRQQSGETRDDGDATDGELGRGLRLVPGRPQHACTELTKHTRHPQRNPGAAPEHWRDGAGAEAPPSRAAERQHGEPAVLAHNLHRDLAAIDGAPEEAEPLHDEPVRYEVAEANPAHERGRRDQRDDVREQLCACAGNPAA